jgi:hypothetical protein
MYILCIHKKNIPTNIYFYKNRIFAPKDMYAHKVTYISIYSYTNIYVCIYIYLHMYVT